MNRATSSRARPAPIHASDEVLRDLEQRLARVRWPEAAGEGWDFGCDRQYVGELVRYWRSSFDWRACERRIEKALPSQRARVRGIDLHFAFRAGCGRKPFPLLLLHGWPSSYVEMIELAGLLAEPELHGGDAADAFDLVIPSLPGHGFSSPPADPLFGADDAAEVLRELMVDVLGYDRFGAQGGDRGAFVATSLAQRFPDTVAGIHLTLASGIAAPEESRSEEERRWLAETARWREAEGGYAAIQSTRPLTLAYALSDSPVGLAAWIIDKWRAWSDCDGDLERRFTKDELLRNVMIYWVTASILPSMRWYAAHRAKPPASMRPERIDVPTGVADFPKEIFRVPRSAVERKFRLVHWSEMARGGHFAALEEPVALAEDVRRFFRLVR